MERRRVQRVTEDLRAHVAGLLGMHEGEVDERTPLLEMGADSLVIVEVIRRVEQDFDVKLTVRQLFEEFVTIEALAAHIDSHAKPTEQPTAPARSEPREDAAPPPPATPRAKRSATHLASRVRTKPAKVERRELTREQKKLVDDLSVRYRARTAASQRRARSAWQTLCDPRRAFVALHPETEELVYQISAERASGAHFVDVDGNDYVDLAMGFGVHLFGHRPELVTEAVNAQLARGIGLGAPTALVEEAADLVAELTGFDRVAFCNSGTEAMMAAIRIARAVTGKKKIALFRNSYHGHSDGVLVKPRSATDHFAAPMALGTTEGAVADVLVLPYGSKSALDVIESHAHELAAVLVEPVQSRQPALQPHDFLTSLRALTRRTNVLLVFDEVLVGFRIHPGGAQAWFGVQADLAAYGKVIGGGFPVAAVAGRADLMDTVDGGRGARRAEIAPIGGTFSLNPLGMAATCAVLRHLKSRGPALQQSLNEKTAKLADSLEATFEKAGAPLAVARFGSLFRFGQSGNFSYVYSPLEFELFTRSLITKGVYVIEGTTSFLSTAHTDEDLARVVDAASSAATELLEAGFFAEARKEQPKNGASVQRANGTAAPKSTPKWRVKREVASEPKAPIAPARKPSEGVAFSISFFGSYDEGAASAAYDLLFESARFADAHGFEAFWIPERHFHPFGGFSPNPAILASAVARATERISIRAGSVVLPLHHPARVAEEWSVVDNLSNGRVEVAFASGWHANDFVLGRGSFSERHADMRRAIDEVRRLWRGEAVRFESKDAPIDVRVFPRPVQKDLPIWLASLGSIETFQRAGELGAGVLTNLINQDIATLAEKIAAYRASLARHGHDPAKGRVAVLVHTLLGEDAQAVKEIARRPLYHYLTSATQLRAEMFSAKSGDLGSLPEADREYLLGVAFERYVKERALIGTVESCAPIVDALIAAGVDEIACFVDFGAPAEAVLEGLDHLAKLKAARKQPAATVEVKEERSPFSSPTTADQYLLWLQSRMGDEADLAYQLRTCLRLEGPFDAEAFERALARVVDRHEAMRTVFTAEGRQQYLSIERRPRHRLIDLSRLDENTRRKVHAEWMAREARERFDLEKEPPFRVTVIALGPTTHQLILTSHHIASDASAVNVIVEELAALYSAEVAKTEASLKEPLQYREFVKQAKERRTPDRIASDEAYFDEMFRDGVLDLALPTDRPRPARKSWRGGQVVMPVGREEALALRKAAQEHGCTPFMAVFTAYGSLLHRLTRQEEIVVGTSVRPRWLPAGMPLVGFTTNLVPLRLRANDRATVREALRAFRSTFLDALEHSEMPFAELIDRLDARDASRIPIVSTTINWDRGAPARFANLEVTLEPQPIEQTRFDIALDVTERDDGLVFYWDYNSDLFDRETIERMHRGLMALLEGMLRSPDARLAALPLAPEHASTLAGPGAPAPDQTLLATVLRHARERADAPAIAAEDGTLTHRELGDRSAQIAAALHAAGIGRGDVVALHVSRGVDLPAAILGTWRAGAAFVALDPDHPADFKQRALRGSGARIVLGRNLAGLEARTMELDSIDAGRAAPEIAIAGNDLAYLIYTSGSTGAPKCAAIRHGNVANYTTAVARALDLKDGAYLWVSPPHVDLGFTMLFGALHAGGVLHVVSRETAESAARLGAYATKHAIDYLKITPTHLDALLSTKEGAAVLPRVRLICGGEAFPWSLVDRIRSFGAGCEIVNHYGPAEATVGVAAYRVPANEGLRAPGSVPVGRPLGETTLHVLDAAGSPLPIGLPGELWIGGRSVGAGYLGDEAATRERFIPDPFASDPSARLYRTGDLARVLPSGDLQVLGRADDQVKIAGFRVEPSMVEAVVREHPSVRQAVVIARDDLPGGRSLAAYVVPSEGSQLDLDDLRSFVEARLPRGIVPASFVRMESLPRLASGKVDRRALPAPAPITGTKIAAAETGDEAAMLEIWREVLGRNTFGVEDDFFNLGGHSLHAIRICARTKEVFGVDLPLDALFDYSTVRSLIASGVVRSTRTEREEVERRPLAS